ncbi:hypothetical protein [Vallitalea maricola]|uniref:Uncharacterized protein n=1 Tax=Vallitalea maricola TaxID=3074433 RepID=A0ACB5UFN7_9FIRM|nr:hypothetical protein AN2V17_09880 [Vallitalea sp. AN17-2]
MKNPEQFNKLLKQALSPTIEPNKEINQKIINQMKEKKMMKPNKKRRISVALSVAIISFALSITALAAWHLLSPKQVAEHFKDETLADAFEQENAIEINESVVSGGYNFTLLGIVSGKDISDFGNCGQNINLERTYAVVSIAKEDGSKMPDIKDEEYGKQSFFISPLIKGQKPWQVNIMTMNGGYQDSVIDGIMYRMIECDGVEIFADRGLYLGIISSTFYDVNAFNYNDETGEISVNDGYQGANVLFDLPLDITKADYVKAEKYLEEMWEDE